jgi:hypothetical protein
LSAKPLKFDLKLVRTVIPGRELLHLRRVFPFKLNIKTYVALCESCRSIAPLQLLVLDIFKLVDTFESYTFLKLGSGNEKRRRRRTAAPACERARPYRRIHVAISRSSGVRICRGCRYGPKPRCGPSAPLPFRAPRLATARAGG